MDDIDNPPLEGSDAGGARHKPPRDGDMNSADPLEDRPEGEPNDSAKKESEANETYTVGYGRPPREHQFRKGESGNPKGRQKGRKNFKTVVETVVGMPTPVRVDGSSKTRTVPTIEAALYRLRQKALTGDIRAIKELLELAADVWVAPTVDPSTLPVLPDDEAIIEAFIKRATRKKEDPSDQGGALVSP